MPVTLTPADTSGPAVVGLVNVAIDVAPKAVPEVRDSGGNITRPAVAAGQASARITLGEYRADSDEVFRTLPTATIPDLVAWLGTVPGSHQAAAATGVGLVTETLKFLAGIKGVEEGQVASLPTIPDFLL